MTPAWALEALFASTLLMAAVLLIRVPVRRAFGAQIAYALWALPALRLVLPPLPADWREAAATPISRASETITVLVVPVADLPATAAAAVVAAPAPLPIGWIAAALWIVGAAAFLGWHLAAHRRFCRTILSDATPVGERAGVRVIASGAATGPLAFGVVRRYVAFPRDFADRYDADERALALDHELGHHARGDLIANWIALVVLALHWWNPLAWRAFRQFRCDQELANDARVLAGRSRTDRHIYACAIVKAAHGGAVSAACHLHTIDDLKGRLKMLTVSRTSRRRLAGGAVTVALLGTVGLGLTVSGSEAAAALTRKVETTTGVDLRQAPPAIPAAPAAPAAPATSAARVPAAPPAPRAPAAPAAATTVNSDVTTVSNTDGKTIRTRVIRRSGPGPVAGDMPIDPSNYVNISSGDCGPDKGQKAFVVTRPEGGRQVTVICTDRITKAAMAGQMTEADEQDIERKALAAALSGLQSSRASIAANMAMPAEARTEALAGIDEALKEIRSDLAGVGKD